MAIWPFGRKSKKTASVDAPPDAVSSPPKKTSTSPAMSRRDPREVSDLSVPTLRHRSSRTPSQKRPRSTSRKLTKSNASSIRNTERVEPPVPPVPALPEERRQELNERAGANRSNQQPSAQPPQDRGDIPSYYFQNPASASSLQHDEKFQAVREPTGVQGKRTADDQGLLRRKSSKRKADDHARLQEIKAMTSPIPIPKRPTSFGNSPLVRDSKRVPGGLNRNLERPLSEISLPTAESMPSQLSGFSEQHAFQVGSFNALLPHSTIKWKSGNPRSPGSSAQPSRTSTRKEKEPIIPEENMHRKRIDDLANDMDTGELRELMERDKRRHEKRRRSENEKLQKRLERRAARQKEREKEALAETNKDSVKDEEVVATGGLGIAEAQSEEGQQPQDQQEEQEPTAGPSNLERPRSPESWLHDPSRTQTPEVTPFQDPRGVSTSHFELTTPTSDREDPVLETAQAVRIPSPGLSPHRPLVRHVHEPSSLSQLSEIAASMTPEPLERPDPAFRRDSDTSNRFSTNWRNIFRRSDTRAKRDSADQGRATPSEFSNTSRESVTRAMPPSAFERIPKVRSGTPKRTQSRFREELTDLPISPPDSRVQSPEILSSSPLSAVPGSRGTDVVGSRESTGIVDDGKRLSDIHPAYREEIALSRHASLRAKSPEATSPSADQPQSLAEVDSEGSWLTGKPVKRLSQPQPIRESQGSIIQQDAGADMDASDEEDGPGTPPAEKYMGSIVPPPKEKKPVIPQRKRPFMSSPQRGNSDDEDEDPPTLHPAPIAPTDDSEEQGMWHGTIGKSPKIVQPGPGPRIKSREGLLNDFLADAPASSPTAMPATGAIATAGEEDYSAGSSPSGDNENYSPDSPEGEGLSIQRATSVDFGKGHARHISAGSARLLNLPPRNSQEIKRMSMHSGERSPLATSPRLPETAPREDDVD